MKSGVSTFHTKHGEGTSFKIGQLVQMTMKVSGDSSPSGLSIIEWTLGPKALGAPPHRHTREDEFTYVLEGTLGVEQDGEVATVGPGGYVAKPRGKMHTFWNVGSAPLRLIEVIVPGDLVGYFRELSNVISTGQATPQDLGPVDELAKRYGMEMDFNRIPELIQRYGVTMA